ncbi:MAG: hypothetical protein RID91_19530 [Azospirillaceae bacterium]
MLFQILLVVGLAAVLFRPVRRFLKTTAGLVVMALFAFMLVVALTTQF